MAKNRLGREQYAVLRLRVLNRDGWRCQVCGRREQLDVHHVQFRSRAGMDIEDNLITVCRRCHRGMHDSAGLKRATLPEQGSRVRRISTDPAGKTYRA